MPFLLPTEYVHASHLALAIPGKSLKIPVYRSQSMHHWTRWLHTSDHKQHMFLRSHSSIMSLSSHHLLSLPCEITKSQDHEYRTRTLFQILFGDIDLRMFDI